jgi:hypothetical protein
LVNENLSLPVVIQNSRVDGLVDVDFDGKRIYELCYYDRTNERHYLPATGSAITSLFRIPMPHRLLSLKLKHTDNTDADNTNALTWSLKHYMSVPQKQLPLTLVSYSASAITDFLETFGEDFPFPDTTYQFIHNTTNTHRIYLTMQIQLLGAI